MSPKSVWIRAGFQITHGDIQLLGIFHGLHHSITSKIGQFRDVFYVKWTGIDTGMTGSTSPHCICGKTFHHGFIGSLSGEQYRGMFIGIRSDIVDYLHRVERLPRFICRAHVLTPCAGSTGPSINELPPGVLAKCRDSESIDIQLLKRNSHAAIVNSQWTHFRHRGTIEEKDIGKRHYQMHMLGKRDEDEKATYSRHVHPIGYDHEGVGNSCLCH